MGKTNFVGINAFSNEDIDNLEEDDDDSIEAFPDIEEQENNILQILAVSIQPFFREKK